MLKNRYKKASSRITRRSRVKNIFGLVLKIGLPVTVLVGLVFLLRADFLQITNFEVVGTETISVESFKNSALSLTSGNKLLVIPKSNLLFLNKNSLANVLLSKFSRIEKVEINKQFFSQSIELKVTERKDDYLWCSENNECFNMTKDGLVFEKTQNVDNKIIFRGILDGNPLMKNFATSAEMKNYINFISVFKNSGFDVSAINIESSDRAIAKTNINNFISDIIFNPEPARHDGESGGETDLSSVAQNIILLINETKSKTPSVHFNYIDARFGNKMFYKLY